jgi:hypothetical protein
MSASVHCTGLDDPERVAPVSWKQDWTPAPGVSRLDP